MGYVTAILVLTLILVTGVIAFGLYTKQTEHMKIVIAQQERNQFEELKHVSFDIINKQLPVHSTVQAEFHFNQGITRYTLDTLKAVIVMQQGNISVTYDAHTDQGKLTNIWPRRQ